MGRYYRDRVGRPRFAGRSDVGERGQQTVTRSHSGATILVAVVCFAQTNRKLEACATIRKQFFNGLLSRRRWFGGEEFLGQLPETIGIGRRLAGNRQTARDGFDRQVAFQEFLWHSRQPR